MFMGSNAMMIYQPGMQNNTGMGMGGMNPMGMGGMNPGMMGMGTGMNPGMGTGMGGMNPGMMPMGGMMPSVGQNQGSNTSIEDIQGWNLIFENQIFLVEQKQTPPKQRLFCCFTFIRHTIIQAAYCTPLMP